MTLKLNAVIRTRLGKKSDEVRAEGKIPAVVYGHNTENINLEMNAIEFEKALKEAGESTIIDLAIDGKEPIKTIISEVQYEPVRGRITHADLRQVNMKEKLHANVPVEFIGESKAVKEEGGIIVHNISEVEIKCLPTDLIHEIKVDISKLATLDDVITVADLKVPATVEILHHELEDVVAMVTRVKEEKEEPVVVAPVEGETAPAEGDKTEEEKK